MSRSTPYADRTIWDYQCGFQHNKSTTDHIFCIYQTQIMEEKWEYYETVHKSFIDSEKAYDSMWKEVLHNILSECSIHTKLIWPIKMCLNKTQSPLRICLMHFLFGTD
jgi:hypothetical protein